MRNFALLIVVSLIVGVGVILPASGELTNAQAVARVRSILKRNTTGCSINQVKSVTAASTRNGWRVTAKIAMSASGSRRNETAVWIVSQRNGAVAQDQLTAEIAIGCP